MRLAISNIAWDVEEDYSIAKLLVRNDIDAIDIAPGKYFPDPTNATQSDILEVKKWWENHNIEITGMQALLFGTTGLNVFGSKEVQSSLLNHLSAICRIGGLLGARRLVFGSPKNRDRTGLSDSRVIDEATDFFYKLGNIAKENDVIVCLEPNPKCYGANFMITSSETASIVRKINHPSIRMQLDTGAITICQEEIDQILEGSSEIIGHIHASEPNLLPIGDGDTNHTKIYNALQRYIPDHIVSIEMLATSHEIHESSIARALATAISIYRPI